MESDVLGRERDDEADRVVISTMHASKGREYKAVVLFDYGRELGSLSSEQVEEERRVCYVGMTRAQSSLLLTIDDAKPLHRFIRESIRPTSPGEETELAERKAAASQEVREAAIDTARATARLGEIANESEERRLASEHAAAHGQVGELEAEVHALEGWLKTSRFWHKLSGRRKRVEANSAALREELAGVASRRDARERDLVLIRAEPDVYGEPFRNALVAAEQRRHAAECELARLEDRLGQLRLLAGESTPPAAGRV